MKQTLESQGTIPIGNSPDDARRWFASERQRWVKVIRDTGFRLEQ